MTKGWIKRIYLPRSLRYQLLVRTLFILAIILLAIGVVQYYIMKDFLYQNEAQTLTARLMTLPRDMGLNGQTVPDGLLHDNGDHHAQDNNRFLFLQDMSLAYIDPSGNYYDLLANNSIQAPKLSKNDYQAVTETLSNHQDVSYKIVTNANRVEQLVVFRPAGDMHGDDSALFPGILQMGTNTASLKHVLFEQLLTFITLSVLALGAGLVFYLRVLKNTLVPLSNINNAVKTINAGNLEERLPVRQGQEEIDRLADTFNAMLERLEVSFEHERETKEQMRRFIADASHELRTPLTSINGFLEVLLRGAANKPEQLEKALNSMHGESRRIIKLVEDLLFLTRLDRAPDLQKTEIILSELVREMEPQLLVLAGSRSVEFELTEGLRGMYESDKIKQVILNLFNNAVHYTDPQSGKIKISLIDTGRNAQISIKDNGMGIRNESLPHIFDRFYRADASRARQYGGSGLGLAITKSIVEAHGGSIEVESQYGDGTTFHVFLPLR